MWRVREIASSVMGATVVLASVSLALLAATTQAETVQRVDLRPPEAEDAHAFYVVLCARKSDGLGTGHTFVVWAETDRRGRVLNLMPQGFYPERERALSHVMGGRGAVVDESTRSASMSQDLLTHRLVCRVDRATYIRAWNANYCWCAAGYDYHILDRNCTHYTEKIAHSLGLAPPVPERGERPPTYLDRLIQQVRRKATVAGRSRARRSNACR